MLDYVIHQPNWKKSRGLTTVFLRFGAPRWKQASLRGVKAGRGFPTSGSLWRGNSPQQQQILYPSSPSFILATFATACLACTLWGFSGGGGFQPKLFWMEHRLLTVLSKGNPQKRNRKAQQQTPKLGWQLEQKQMD